MAILVLLSYVVWKLSGGSIFGVVDIGLYYDRDMDQPDNYQTTYDSKTNIVVFYSLSNAFDLIFGVNLEKI